MMFFHLLINREYQFSNNPGDFQGDYKNDGQKNILLKSNDGLMDDTENGSTQTGGFTTVVALSGGVDSSTSLIIAKMLGFNPMAVTVNPGDIILPRYFRESVEKLTLISGNRTIIDSSELLSSGMMADLVKEMANRYDDRYVFFDAPPVLGQSEAISMAPLMDGILMVVEAGRTSKKDVQAAVELLPKEKFLGFVLNKQDS